MKKMVSFLRGRMPRRRVGITCVLAAMLSLAPGAPLAAAPNAGWLSLTASRYPNTCTWTITVTWAGISGAKTLEAFLTETYTGVPLVPAFVPVHNKSGTATIILAPLAPSTSFNPFYGWAQLVDAHGDVIVGSADFANGGSAYCTAP